MDTKLNTQTFGHAKAATVSAVLTMVGKNILGYVSRDALTKQLVRKLIEESMVSQGHEVASVEITDERISVRVVENRMIHTVCLTSADLLEVIPLLNQDHHRSVMSMPASRSGVGVD